MRLHDGTDSAYIAAIQIVPAASHLHERLQTQKLGIQHTGYLGGGHPCGIHAGTGLWVVQNEECRTQVAAVLVPD